jgi:putative DNA primase/helicase
MSMTLDIPALLKKLVNKGADLKGTLDQKRHFVSDVVARLPDNAGVYANRTGWHDTTIILPTSVVNGSRSRFHLADEIAVVSAPNFGVAGSLQTWKSTVATLAASSSYAAFAIMHCLAAPLYRFSELSEGVIFNFVAETSRGKTTAIQAGASVYGRPARLSDWNKTPRAQCVAAAAHSDLALILDDVERLPPGTKRLDLISTATHVLTAGKSTEYAEMVRDHCPCWSGTVGAQLQPDCHRPDVPRSQAAPLFQ